MGLVGKGSDWKEIPTPLWEPLEPFLPPPPRPPRRNGGRPRVCPRAVLTRILFILRTGAQWNALDMLSGPSRSTVHRYYQEWVAAGVFERIWARALEVYDTEAGIVWEWLVADGSLGKAPLQGEKTGPNPTDRAKSGVKRSILTEGRGVPVGWRSPGPTARTTSGWPRRWPRYRWPAPRRRRRHRSICVPTKATTMPTWTRSSSRRASPRTFPDAGPGPGHSRGHRRSRRAGGWWSAPTPGSTRGGTSFSAGIAKILTIWRPCSSLPPSSPSAPPGFWDRL